MTNYIDQGKWNLRFCNVGKHLRRMLISLLYIYIFVVIRDLWGPVPNLPYMHYTKGGEVEVKQLKWFHFQWPKCKALHFPLCYIVTFPCIKKQNGNQDSGILENYAMLQFKLMFNSSDRKLKWVFWSPVVNLIVCKLFTFSSSSSKVQKFQLNLAQNILGWRGLDLFKWQALAFSKRR